MAAGLGLVDEALDTEGLAQLGDGLAALEHVRAGQLEGLVGNPDTGRTPSHSHVVLARDLPSGRLSVTLPTSQGLKKRM